MIMLMLFGGIPRPVQAPPEVGLELVTLGIGTVIKVQESTLGTFS